MLKLQQYKIFKFESDRLRDVKYKVNLSVKEAYDNGEIVSLGESELIRIVNRLKGKVIDYQNLNDLSKEKHRLKKQPDIRSNRKRIFEINQQIESVLFIPELVNVAFTDPRHYKAIIKNGLFVNGKRFVRLLTGAGMARRSTVQFVEEEFSKKLKPLLDNDRNKNIPLVDSKYNAYYALVSSATYPVSIPRFCVVKDYEYVKERLVDFVVEVDDGDDQVEERLMLITSNAFDGQGICSLEQAEKWAHELDLDYVPNSYCIRGAYLKGQCVAFDFKRFAQEIADKNIIIDAWGQEVDINSIDAILTTSQLKLWNCYSSCQEYQDACLKNGIGWGVSRFTPKKEKDHFYSSYQLLQVLDLSEEQIKNLCQPTIDWISKVAGGDVNYALLYLLGDVCKKEELKPEWFNSLNGWNLKALLLNHKLFGDSYIKKSIYQTLNKKIKEARMGRLLFPGNWQVAISDPYAFCEHVFGMDVQGLLKENEHYCRYWIDKGVDTVASGRSPLTWKSEMNVLHLKNDDKLKDWFSHIKSGVVLNVHGVDSMLYADGDFDFDIIFSTNQKEFLLGATGGKPVTYEKKLPPKNIIDDDKLYLADINTMGSRIGKITNLGTSLYSLAPLFDKNSKEYAEIIKRLIVIRKCQGNEIDRGKGILVKSLPNWDKWIKMPEEVTQEEKEAIELHNRLVINRRPKFMIYLYPEYMRKYKNHKGIYDNYCESIYGYDLKDMIAKDNKSKYEQEIIDMYQEFYAFIESKSVMGIICDHMETTLNEVKLSLKDAKDFKFDSLVDSSIPLDHYKLKKMQEFYREYKAIKKEIYDCDEDYETVNTNIAQLKERAYQVISSNGAELANLAIELCYKEYAATSRDFCWRVFGEEIITNMIENRYDTALVPLADDFGNIHYLENRYSSFGINVKDCCT